MEVYQLTQIDLEEALEVVFLLSFLIILTSLVILKVLGVLLSDFYFYSISPRIFKEHPLNKSVCSNHHE